MSIPGRQEQTLVYRVELDESSVAQIIRTARESVGVGLQQAVSMGNSVTSQGQLTAATAIANVGSHLEFLERTRSALGAPASMSDTAAGMGIAQALGVKAGIVQPGFSELRGDLERRAQTALGGTYSTTGLSVMGGVASVGLAGAGIALGLAFPPGLVMGAAMVGGEMALDGGIGSMFDRAIGRTQIAAHLRRFGPDRSFQIARQFERDTGMLSGGFSEMADVAKATLTNIRFQPGDNVNSALVDAIGDYRIAGKLLNMDKEQALATTQELYRAGVSPGQAAGYFGTVSAMSMKMGYDPAALHARALDFGRSAAAGGYGAFDSMNQYMIQSSMVSQMVRSGSVNREMLTAAAGFAGPEGEQVMAAAKNMATATLAFQQTGMGRGMLAGLMSGGNAGDLNSLMGAAAGMSTQDILSLGGRQPGAQFLGASQKALSSAAATAITAAGGTVNQQTMTSALRSIGGMDFGTAQMMAVSHMNPGNVGLAQFSGELREMQARSETMGQPGSIGRVGSQVATAGANVISHMWRDADFSWYTNPTIRRAQGNPEDGRRILGIRGWGSAAVDALDITVGELGRDIGEGFQSMGNYALEAMGFNPVAIGRGDTIGVLMSRQDIRRLGRGGIRRLTARAAGLSKEWVSASHSGTSFRGFIQARRREIMGRQLDSDSSYRAAIANDLEGFNRAAGLGLDGGQYKGLVTDSQKYLQAVRGAATREERAEAIGEFQGWLEAANVGIDTATSGKAADFLIYKQQFAFSQGDENELVELSNLEGLKSRMDVALGTKQKREQVAQMYFKEGSKSYDRLVKAEGLDYNKFEKLAQSAVAAGDIRPQAAGKLRQYMKQGVSATTAIAMGTLESSSAELVGGKPKAETDSPTEKGQSQDVSKLITALENLIAALEK